MRYPIYFFLLLSGFFYLTGQPGEDVSGQTGADKGQAQLPYARNAANRFVAKLDAEKASKNVKTVVEPVGINTDMVKRTMPAMVNVASKTPAANKESAAAKTGTAVSETDGSDVSAKKDASRSNTAKAPEAVQSAHLARKTRLDRPSRKTLKSAQPKKLDWTVFGNRPKRVAAVIPKRMRSRDELDANGLTSERKIVRRKIRKRTRTTLSRSARKAQRRAKKRIRKSRKARMAKRRKSRRFARLNKRHRNVRRIASRRSVRKARKKSTPRSKRRKFGFGTVGGVTSLMGN